MNSSASSGTECSRMPYDSHVLRGYDFPSEPSLPSCSEEIDLEGYAAHHVHANPPLPGILSSGASGRNFVN